MENKQKSVQGTGAYSELYHTSKMELLKKNLYLLSADNYFQKLFHLRCLTRL